MNVTVSANDERAIEVLASGLPLFQGAQLAVDITIRSVCSGSKHVAHRRRGFVASQKERSASMQNCWLVTVVDVEMGGRWSAESVEFINCLAAPKAREAPMVLRGSVSEGWRRRWTRMLSVSCSRGFRVFFGVSQFCGSCRGRRRCSRVGRSAHGVSGLSGVRGGPCEVAFLFSANFLSAVSVQLQRVGRKRTLLSRVINPGTVKVHECHEPLNSGRNVSDRISPRA